MSTFWNLTLDDLVLSFEESVNVEGSLHLLCDLCRQVTQGGRIFRGLRIVCDLATDWTKLIISNKILLYNNIILLAPQNACSTDTDQHNDSPIPISYDNPGCLIQVGPATLLEEAKPLCKEFEELVEVIELGEGINSHQLEFVALWHDHLNHRYWVFEVLNLRSKALVSAE